MSRRTPSVGRGLQSAVIALALALLAVVAVAALAVQPATAARATSKAAAKVALTQAKVTGQTLTLAGRVELPRGAAIQRRRVKVAFALAGARGKSERFTGPIDARHAFRLRRATKLTGRLALTVRVTIGGRQSGRALTRSVTVKAAARTTTPTTGGGGTTTPGGGGGTTPPPAPGPAPAPVGATPLIGLFKLDAGQEDASGRRSGTWFAMLNPGGEPMSNHDSPFRDKDFTPLGPGSDGGLRTDAYQEPPVPAYSGPWVEAEQILRGDALASRIVQPQKFFGVNFSIVTAATDAQTGSADPLPQISHKDGRISGQVTAWVAQWNGISFNQGAPKPDGTLPGRTAALSGTYDAATRRFVLEWKSLIVGGPFDTFTGSWHLEGTFVPS
ncbi:hypothetical protein VSS74_13300 [Conexibacter stalactiti]|uniref:Uncharacterized protein n=1 Tax=Conexibacter stalactiti TaxID=1940611 RepID=A0ABU4HPT4_9ACTN|nr:hypothetical protein [Conexibacter stalactiti]MDW5595318.1 hypothetical protein [Conexibacter stalactiti]MEC5035960.1 hypothetical protein [Conexibacter stalactiti]